jgi:hypothetical protein
VGFGVLAQVEPQFTPEKSRAAKAGLPWWSAIIFLWVGLILARSAFAPVAKAPATASVAGEPATRAAAPVGISAGRALLQANEADDDVAFTGSANAAPLEPVGAHASELPLRVSVQFCTS